MGLFARGRCRFVNYRAVCPGGGGGGPGDFYEDRAAVRPEVTAGYGYIDPSGNMVIQPEYDAAGMFSEGRAAVLSDGLWGYVNATGEVVLSLQYSQAGRFSSGLAAVGDR